MAQTVGSLLTVDRSPEARALSLALTKYLKKLDQLVIAAGGTLATVYDGDPACRVFVKTTTGAPGATTGSPGGDCCFVVNTYDNDLYFISGWSNATTFTATKILDTVA